MSLKQKSTSDESASSHITRPAQRIFGDWAPVYNKAGFYPRPRTEGKVPRFKGWSEPGPASDDMIRKFSYCGIGLALGSPIGNGTYELAAVDIDVDGPWVRVAKAVLNSPCARFGSKGIAIFVKVPWFDRPKEGEKGKKSNGYKFKLGDKTKIGELLATSSFCVIPPTLHPTTGKPYTWVGTPLLEQDLTQLPVFPAKLFEVLLKSEHLATLMAAEKRPDGSWGTNEDVLRLSAQLVAHADDDLIERIIRAALPENYDGDSFEPSELPRMIREAREKGFDKHMPDDERPVVQVCAGALHKMADEAEQALITVGAPFYVRSGRLVRPVLDWSKDSKQKDIKTPRLVSYSLPNMLDYLSRGIKWVKWIKPSKSDEGKLVPVDPPRLVAEILLNRDGDWNFPRLVGFTTTPTLRPDGSLLIKPGFDEQTGLLLVDPPPMPLMPTAPTREDALQALAVLDDLIKEFPFVDETSRSVGLSALMTPVMRAMFPVVPAHITRAPDAGTGKSYLFDIASAIAMGTKCPVVSAGKNEEETEKRLGGIALAGDPIVSIDNVNGAIGGSFLCQLIERTDPKVRRLGASDVFKCENRSTVFINGNNVTVMDDMVRRCVMCSMDAQMEEPWKRQFKGDPFGKVMADRGKYIAAVLTIVRAYMVAGRPDKLPAFGSFQEWSDNVRSALVWLGQADPVQTQESLSAEDPIRGQLRDVLNAWADLVAAGQIDSAPMTSGELAKKVAEYENSDLAEKLRDVSYSKSVTEINSNKLGKWLSKNAGRRLGGLRIESVLSRTKQKTYRLVDERSPEDRPSAEELADRTTNVVPFEPPMIVDKKTGKERPKW